MFGFDGSSKTRRTPRTEHGVRFRATFVVFLQPVVKVAPLKMNDQVVPPSVVLYRPQGGAPGARLTAPPEMTEEMPRTARVVATYIVLESAGSMAIDPMARALNELLPIGPLHVSPPSIDLYNPTPASLSADALASPVPTQTILLLFGSSVMELAALIA